MSPRQAVWIRAVLLLLLIVVTPPVVAWMHFGGSWNACLDRHRPHAQSLKAEEAASASARTLLPDTAKRTCIMIETAHAAVAAIGIFGLVMLLWWQFSDVSALGHIFERPWKYLDDGDVESIGAMKSVAYAAVFALVLLASAGVLFLSVAGALDPETRLFDPAGHTDEPTANEKAGVFERSTARLVDALVGKLSEHQVRYGSESKRTGAAPTDEEGRPVPTKQTGSASLTNKEGSPPATNKEASAAPIDGQVAPTPATEESSTTPTNEGVEPLRQPTEQASLPSSGACFTPEFRIDPDQNVQRLRAESATERRRIGLPDGATFREIADHVVFFDSAASRLSSGAEERLTQFLSSRPAGHAALSIRGFADGRGSPATNERLSRDRAVEVATLVANSHRYPPTVELDWSVHGAAAPPMTEVSPIRTSASCASRSCNHVDDRQLRSAEVDSRSPFAERLAQIASLAPNGPD